MQNYTPSYSKLKSVFRHNSYQDRAVEILKTWLEEVNANFKDERDFDFRISALINRFLLSEKGNYSYKKSIIARAYFGVKCAEEKYRELVRRDNEAKEEERLQKEATAHKTNTEQKKTCSHKTNEKCCHKNSESDDIKEEEDDEPYIIYIVKKPKVKKKEEYTPVLNGGDSISKYIEKLVNEKSVSSLFNDFFDLVNKSFKF